MRHNWIIGVLSDLRSYAELNNLPAIATAATQALGIAEAEIAASVCGESDAMKNGISTD